MKKALQFVSLALMFGGALLLFEQPARAYTDPGTGLLAVQAIGSMLAAAGWYMRRKIYTFFRRGPVPAPVPEEHPNSNHDEGSSQS
jgi:hypothetical protein